MMLLGWVNLIALLGLLVQGMKPWPLPRGERPLIAVLLLWLTLIMTGHTLSLFSALNNGWAYCAVSLGWLALLVRLLPCLTPFTRHETALLPLPALSFYRFTNPQTEQRLTILLLALLGCAAVASALLIFNNTPGNADSVSYRLPRAFWYVSQGHLLHPFEALDKRTIFYPLNGTLLYVPLVTYGFPGTFHNLPTFIAWLVVTLTTYRFARVLGAPRALSLLATALAVLAPNILVQASATNDEILSGGALLLALYTLLRWTQSGQNFYFLCAAALAGISIGTKLHIVFYLPVIALGLLCLLRGIAHAPAKAKGIARHIGLPTALASLTLGLLMIAPFLLYNYISSGRFYFTGDFAGDFFNTQLKLQVFGQNLLIYLTQLFLAPAADLYGSSDSMAREAFHAKLNDFFVPLYQPLLSTEATDYHLQYRFKGVTLKVSPYFLEYSLWAGFSFLLAPLLWVKAWQTRRGALGQALLLLACAPVIWFITWCASTLYMEGTPTYLAYYLVIAAPTMLFALLHSERRWYNRLRWALIGFVLATHCLIACNTFRYNEFRNIPRLFSATRLPYDWALLDMSAINEIKMAEKIRIGFTRWGMSYFSIMQYNPQAFYYGPQEPVPDIDKTLALIAVPSAAHWGFAPLYLPQKPNPGLTFIGKMRGWGAEGVFAVGNGVAQRWPDRNRYVLFQARTEPTPQGTQLILNRYLPDFSDSDALEYHYALWLDKEKAYATRDWSADAAWTLALPQLPPGSRGATLKIAVRVANDTAPPATYDMALHSQHEWTDTLIGVTPWIDKVE